MLIYYKSLTFDHKVLKMLTEYSRIDFSYLYVDHFTSGVSSMINYKIGPFVSQSTKGSIRMFLHTYHLQLNWMPNIVPIRSSSDHRIPVPNTTTIMITNLAYFPPTFLDSTTAITYTVKTVLLTC